MPGGTYKRFMKKLKINRQVVVSGLLLCVTAPFVFAKYNPGYGQTTSNVSPIISKPDIDTSLVVEKAVKILEERDEQLKQAVEHYNRKEWISAIDVLRQVLAQSPDHETALNYFDKIRREMISRVENWRGMSRVEFSAAQGMLAYINEEWKSAIDFLENGKIMDPNYDRELELGIRNARRYLTKVVQQEKEDRVEELIEMAKEFLNKKEYDSALETCNQVLALNSNNLHAQELAIQAKIALNKLGEQKKKEEILKYVTIAVDLFTEDKYQESFNAWKKVLQLDPKHEAALEYVTRCKEKLAAAMPKSQLTVEPEQWKVPNETLATSINGHDFSRGLNYLQHEMYLEAVEELEKVIKDNPDFIPAQNALAEAKIRQEGAAERYYKEALVAYSQGNRADAIKNWSIVLKIDPSYQKARQALIKAQAELEGTGQQ